MLAETCEICYENEPTFTCSTCKCKLCADCLFKCYMKRVDNDNIFRCVNCNSELSVVEVFKGLKNDYCKIQELINHMGEIKYKRLKLESYKLERCVKAIKLRNQYRELLSNPAYLRKLNEISEYICAKNISSSTSIFFMG